MEVTEIETNDEDKPTTKSILPVEFFRWIHRILYKKLGPDRVLCTWFGRVFEFRSVFILVDGTDAEKRNSRQFCEKWHLCLCPQAQDFSRKLSGVHDVSCVSTRMRRIILFEFCWIVGNLGPKMRRFCDNPFQCSAIKIICWYQRPTNLLTVSEREMGIKYFQLHEFSCFFFNPPSGLNLWTEKRSSLVLVLQWSSRDVMEPFPPSFRQDTLCHLHSPQAHRPWDRSDYTAVAEKETGGAVILHNYHCHFLLQHYSEC